MSALSTTIGMKTMKLWRSFLWLAVMAVSLAAPAAETVIYYHNDLAGSPVVATDASGNVIWRESYRPYGERLTNAPASADNKIWFTSRRQDAVTGLVYMGARYYDPVIGRFISTDPAGFDESNIHSHNRYAYANNNPYRYKDPSGRVAETVWDLASFTLSVGIFKQDPSLGNFLGAAVDGVALAIPLVPGGVGAIRTIGKGASDAVQAAGINSNKLHHIFGNSEHKLDSLVRASGSEERAYQAVQEGANVALREGRLAPDKNGILPGGSSGAVLEINGINVQLVGGRVVNGEVKIGSFSRRDLGE